MAPNLTAKDHEKIEQWLREGRLTNKEIANNIGCSIRAIEAARLRLRIFGKTRRRPSPQPSIDTPTGEALKQFVFHNPDRQLGEMKGFLKRHFELSVSERTVRRTLKGWSKKVMRRRARQQDPELRHYYMHKLSAFHSYQLIYIDESGCDLRVGRRNKGWAPRGVTPVQVEPFQRGKRYQILPAYTQDGILVAQIFEGTTNADIFESFIREVLDICRGWHGSTPVLVMDNARIHRSPRVRQMCIDAGVELLYLPPYSPDFNPIEEFFAELKAFVRQNWWIYESRPEQGFANFLRGCIDVVGRRSKSARGHFRHAGVTVEER